jgi:hypothetical protein
MILLVALAGCAFSPAADPSSAPVACGHIRASESATTVSAGSSSLPTAYVLPTRPADDMDADLVMDEVIPAGGSVDVPLTFECSSFAWIQVVSLVPGVTASFGGIALKTGTATDFTSAAASISNPADGTLHIVNTTAVEAAVRVVASVKTMRHLTVTPVNDFVPKGGSVSFDAQVSEATDADGASAYLQDSAGTKTPIALTKVGPGHWTGHVSPTVSGTNTIYVETSGGRVRYGDSLVSVSTGNVTFGSGFTESLADTNGDGLADQLVLTPTVIALKPGKYSLNADLVDSTGARVTYTGGAVSLTAGAQPLPISFLGTDIYNSGLSGPYRLVNVSLSDESADPSFVDAQATDLGATQVRDYRLFQH